MTDLLSDQNKIWLNAFKAKQGRSPRVLLIGNIANNAYNNAKILNEAGLDCDVICYDYYHVMGCPEWEDADLSCSPKNDFRPDWTQVSMGFFERPRWFAQGQLADCIDYLVTRREGVHDLDNKWRMLLIRSLVVRPRSIKETLARSSFAFKGWGSLQRIRLQVWLNDRVPMLYSHLRKFKRLKHFASRNSPAVVGGSDEPAAFRDADTSSASIEDRSRELVRQFAIEFPGRGDKFLPTDVDTYTPHFDGWKRLMSLYDIVIGFSTDPFLPLLCDKPYFAVEHGTLRDIPFAADGQGRRTALAYRLARHCFVTNFDCAESAQVLAPGRYTLINHPYDEDHGFAVAGADKQRADLKRALDCDFLFFHPTRQDWVEGTGYADKRNDVFLHAFAALRRRGLRVGLVICSWGANVHQSKQLIEKLDCDAYVHWTPPLAITPFERMCKACDVVVDQFKLGAFGGVVFKAMAVGTPIVTFLNEELIIRQYPEPPPVINCQSSADIEHAIAELIEQPARLAYIGLQLRDWIRRHHGKRETVNKQVDQFRRFLPIPSADSAAVVT
jgi:glycosyltransferase involved in cell wall biosynthesis